MATQLRTEKRDKPGPAKTGPDHSRALPAAGHGGTAQGHLADPPGAADVHDRGLVFVLVMVVIVTSLDYAFTKLVFWAFG